MRYQKGHKEETRRQILDTASTRFRREGINAVGIKSLMADAGLTHGGFYAHFQSKDDLVAEALGEALGDTFDLLAGASAQAAGGDRLESFIEAYLSAAHRDRVERGCAGAALAAEAARESPEARAHFTGGILRIVDELARLLPDGSTEERKRERALAVFGGMMGSLQLARAVDDPAVSDSILEGGRKAALELAKAPWSR